MAEDFANTCNADGSLKTQLTTTFASKDDPSEDFYLLGFPEEDRLVR